ncbi:MAG: glycosyltransferase family 4 protein [Bacteroidia bacterium]
MATDSLKIAICSVNQSAYSETFILAHKNLLKGNILFYNTGWIPQKLESDSILPSDKIFHRIYRILLRKLNLLKYTDIEHGFYNSLKREKPDVILAEFAICGAEIYSIAKKLKIPLVIHCHGMDVSHKPTIETYKDKYEAAFAYADSVIGVSKQMCRKLEELKCAKEKIIYSCYGPDPEFFKVQSESDGTVAIAIGRFVEKKTPHLTLFAFKKALEKKPNAKLRMIGGGELLSFCKDIAMALKIENSVTFAGILNPKQIRQEMKSAAFFVQHSRTSQDGDMEGTPVAILEAQAASLPVVATNHAGIPDIVIHDETGLLSAEGDVDTMAENMLKLFENKEMCEHLGRNARERIMKHFTMGQHILKLQKVLAQAANKDE